MDRLHLGSQPLPQSGEFLGLLQNQGTQGKKREERGREGGGEVRGEAEERRMTEGRGRGEREGDVEK